VAFSDLGAKAVLARLLVESLLCDSHMPERRPGVRGATRDFAVAKVLPGPPAVRDRAFELVRRRVVERCGLLEPLRHLVLGHGRSVQRGH
jgi:hypothetical protein